MYKEQIVFAVIFIAVTAVVIVSLTYLITNQSNIYDRIKNTCINTGMYNLQTGFIYDCSNVNVEDLE